MVRNNKRLSAHLSVPETDYAVGEDIIVTLSLRNESANPLIINRRCGIRSFPFDLSKGPWEVDFEVTFGQVNCLRMGVIIERKPGDADDFIRLDSGAEYVCQYKITNYFKMKSPGTYSIVASYQNSDDGHQYGLVVWTGEIISNTINIKVIQQEVQ